MILSKDWREFIESLNSHGVEFVLVGGHAVAYHARPRFTDDLDLLIRRTPENARRIVAAMTSFGFGGLGLTEEDFLEPKQVIQLGFPPNRIDITTSITGIDDDSVWDRRIADTWEGLTVWWIDRESLIRNKRAVARAKDLADLELLGE